MEQKADKVNTDADDEPTSATEPKLHRATKLKYVNDHGSTANRRAKHQIDPLGDRGRSDPRLSGRTMFLSTLAVLICIYSPRGSA